VKIVKDDWFSEAGSLGQAHIARNYALKDLGAKKPAKIGGYLAGESGALIEHGEKNSFDFEARIESAANAHEGVEEFGDAFESELFALDGNHDGVGGDEGVEGKEVESGRAIENDEFVAIVDLAEEGLKLVFAIFGENELDGSASEVFVGGDDIQAVDLGLLDDFLEGFVENEAVVESAAGRVLGKTDGGGGVGLGVAIDEEGGLIGSGEASGKIDGGRGFADSAFLIGHSNNASHVTPEWRKVSRIEEGMQLVSRGTWQGLWKAGRCSTWNTEYAAD